MRYGGRFALCHRPERLCDVLCALRAQGLVIDTVLGDADGDLIQELLGRGYISFYAGKQSALPEGIVFRFLKDLHLYWEFYIYGHRGHRLTAVERELIRAILDAVSPEETQA